MSDEEEKDKLKRIALRKAMGYTATEVTEEYAVRDGEETLVRRKVVSKEMPPDLSALRWLLGEGDGTAIGKEELERERKELTEQFFRLLEKENEKENKENGT